jgi:hypothetical protein
MARRVEASGVLLREHEHGERLPTARFRLRPAALPAEAARRAGQTEQIAGRQTVDVAVNGDDSALILGLGKSQPLDRARQGSLEPGSYRHTTIRHSSKPRR